MIKNGHFRWDASRVVSAGLLSVILGACGDQNLFDSLSNDNTTAAKVESAKIAIDDGKFTQAIGILQELCGTDVSAPACDAETASLLASAYAGRAGVNVFDLIENSGGVLSGMTTSSLSTFSTLLSAPTDDDKSDLHDAVTILEGLSNPTANQNLQMAIYAMADAVVTVGVDLTDGYNSSSGRPNTVPLTIQPIEAAEASEGTLSQVASDLELAIEGLDGAGLGNENLKNDIENLRDQIDQPPRDGVISSDEMLAFLQNP